MKRLLVNDFLTTIPGTRTFWHDLHDWFGMEFVGGDYVDLPALFEERFIQKPDDPTNITHADVTLIVRNATWFGPLAASATVPTISLLQDIVTEGPQRQMQDVVIATSTAVVFNSAFTAKHYTFSGPQSAVIPLPVDFEVFRPGNPMGLQQALSLPPGCVLWVGASQGAAAQVKGFDIFWSIVRANPDIPFVAVFKDSIPPSLPPNVRAYERVTHADLVNIIGACRMGLCTSRTESQHLAGIEMGACGLPLVVPPVGVYWQRADMPGVVVEDPNPASYGQALRTLRFSTFDPEAIRAHWMTDSHPEVCRLAWTALVTKTEAA